MRIIWDVLVVTFWVVWLLVFSPFIVFWMLCEYLDDGEPGPRITLWHTTTRRQ